MCAHDTFNPREILRCAQNDGARTKPEERFLVAQREPQSGSRHSLARNDRAKEHHALTGRGSLGMTGQKNM
jgi:hypothetical protein